MNLKGRLLLIFVIYYTGSSVYSQDKLSQQTLRENKKVSLSVGGDVFFKSKIINTSYTLNKYLILGLGYSQADINMQYDEFYPFDTRNVLIHDFSDKRYFGRVDIYPVPQFPVYLGLVIGKSNGIQSEFHNEIYSNGVKITSTYNFTSRGDYFYGGLLGTRLFSQNGVFIDASFGAMFQKLSFKFTEKQVNVIYSSPDYQLANFYVKEYMAKSLFSSTSNTHNVKNIYYPMIIISAGIAIDY